MEYISPEVKDYGDLVALTADTAGMAQLGFGTLAAVSSPVVPSAGGGGDTLGSPNAGETLGDFAAEGDTGSGDGGSAGDTGSGSGSGGSSGGGGGGGGAAGNLPFTGFAAAAVGALGAGIAAAGATARKYLTRR